MMVRAALMPLAMLALLPGCALQPLYTGGSSGAAVAGLSSVDVPAIEGRSGWLVRNALVDRLGTANNGSAKYRLDVRLDDQLEALGVLDDETVGRERRILRARYQLVDVASDTILLDATAGSDAGIDVVSSEYATIAAEQTALERLAEEVADRIVTQLALTMREGGS